LIVVEQDGKRFFNIRAQKATKKTGIKIKENETEQSFLSDLKKEYGAEAKIEKDDDDTYTVTYLAPQTELLEYNPENKASLPGAFIDYADKWLANKTVDATGEGDSIFKKTK
jgi:dihydroneopterin aldolase